MTTTTDPDFKPPTTTTPEETTTTKAPEGLVQGQSVRAQAEGDTSTTAAPAHEKVVVLAALAGGAPHVKVLRANDGTVVLRSFYAYPEGFRGGVNVALGDVDGDGYQDIITGAGPSSNGAPHVKVFSGLDNSVIKSFYAFGEDFRGGVFVGSCDVNGDGKSDIIAGAGPSANGAPHVKLFDGASSTNALLASFYAYPESFRGGVRVASADLTGDGKAEIITGAGPSTNGAPHVRSFSIANGVATPGLSFYAYGENFRGGVFVGAGCDGDHKALIITGAGAPGSQHVRLIEPNGALVSEFIAPNSGSQGATVGIGQFDDDAADEFIVGSASQNSFIRPFNQPAAPMNGGGQAFPGFTGGVSVAGGVI